MSGPDTTTTPLGRQSVKGGQCSPKDFATSSFCALDSTECHNAGDYSWISGREVGLFSHGFSCLESKQVKATSLGKCADGSCSPNAETCGGNSTNTTNFSKSSSSCTVENTKYGKCGDRCSWSPDECLSDEEWLFPAEECSCDNVRVGACTYTKYSSVTCAISFTACDESSVWVPPLNVPDMFNFDCFLCRATSAPVPSPPAREIEIIKSESLALDNDNGNGNVGRSDENNTTLLGGAIGGVIAAVLSVGALLYTHRRGKGEASFTPPRTIKSSSMHGISFPDKDDISELDHDEISERIDLEKCKKISE